MSNEIFLVGCILHTSYIFGNTIMINLMQKEQKLRGVIKRVMLCVNALVGKFSYLF